MKTLIKVTKSVPLITQKWLSFFRISKLDNFLRVSILLALVFSLNGFYWGLTAYGNNDEMALATLFSPGHLPFEPINFFKPPFHTYFNLFLARIPVYVAEKLFLLLGISIDRTIGELLWSRFITACLFAGSTGLVFRIVRRFFGLISARITALILATSAGFIVEAHYLTADIPLVFWMLVAFAFAQNILFEGRLRDYLWTGFFVGLATATKYNGLATGITLVIAHLLLIKPTNLRSWISTIFSRKLILGFSMVVGGFLVGNPFSVIIFPEFIADFIYNYRTTPVYDGSPLTDTSYIYFFNLFNEIIGAPIFILSIIAVVYTGFLFLKPQKDEKATQGFLLLLSVFLLYYYKFGSFPRLEVRFILPIVPFWLMMMGLFWEKMWILFKHQKILLLSLLVGLFSYNAISAYAVGNRFSDDPRMQAIEWVKTNVPVNSVIETTPFAPVWSNIPNIQAETVKMPKISGRSRLFKEFFKDDPWMTAQVKHNEGDNEKEQKRLEWYFITQLKMRDPDYIALCSLYYDRFFYSKVAHFYPTMKQFFSDILKQPTPYQIVFDKTSKKQPFWIYPRKILFIDNRLLILKKQG